MAARFSVVARKIFAHRHWWHLHNLDLLGWLYRSCPVLFFWHCDYLFVLRVFQAAQKMLAYPGIMPFKRLEPRASRHRLLIVQGQGSQLNC